MSVFERLQQRLNVEKRDEGISAIEIADLPSPLRKIMRLMLREVELSYPDLREAVEAMPAKDRMSKPELDQALEVLTRQFWLIRRGEGERVTYQVNLRRKAGSKLAAGVWSALGDKIILSREADTAESKLPGDASG